MSLGTAIVLSALLLCLVLLYGFTRDRWKWRRIFGQALICILGIGALLAAALAAWNWLESLQRRPVLMTALWSVKLGDKESDVVFRKGQPTEICSDPDRPNRRELWFKISGNNANDLSWAQVLVDANKGVTAIAFFGDLSKSEQTQPLKIYTGQSADSVRASWGKPSNIKAGRSATGQSYYYDQFNLIVVFGTNRAEALIQPTTQALATTALSTTVWQPSDRPLEVRLDALPDLASPSLHPWAKRFGIIQASTPLLLLR